MSHKQYSQLGQSISENGRQPGTGRNCQEVGRAQGDIIERDLREKQQDEERRKKLEEKGNGKYCNEGASFRLLYHANPHTNETLQEFISLREEIIGLINSDNISKDDLQSLHYGLLGELGSRRLNAYIEVEIKKGNLTPEEIKRIGYNDARYLGIEKEKLGLLLKNQSYMIGFRHGEIIDIPSDNSHLDDVVKMLHERLEEKKNKRRR